MSNVKAISSEHNKAKIKKSLKSPSKKIALVIGEMKVLVPGMEINCNAATTSFTKQWSPHDPRKKHESAESEYDGHVLFFSALFSFFLHLVIN